MHKLFSDRFNSILIDSRNNYRKLNNKLNVIKMKERDIISTQFIAIFVKIRIKLLSSNTDFGTRTVICALTQGEKKKIAKDFPHEWKRLSSPMK